jgi:hypothetical protein
MTDSTITAWTGQITAYTVQGPTGLTFGTFTQWEHAQYFAVHNTGLSTTGELLIVRGMETLEIVQEGRKALELKIAGGVCQWCEVLTDVVHMPDGPICQDCAGECGMGENVWDYLRG